MSLASRFLDKLKEDTDYDRKQTEINAVKLRIAALDQDLKTWKDKPDKVAKLQKRKQSAQDHLKNLQKPPQEAGPAAGGASGASGPAMGPGAKASGGGALKSGGPTSSVGPGNVNDLGKIPDPNLMKNRKKPKFTVVK